MTTTTSPPFEIDVQAVQRYFFRAHLLLIVLVGIWFFGLGLLVAAIAAVTWAPGFTRRQAEALKYWLEGGTLRVDSGVWVLTRKAIALDRVTEVMLVQGPLMRRCGIWALYVQTAGQGHAVAEATLFGLREPERVRDELLAARDRAVAARARA